MPIVVPVKYIEATDKKRKKMDKHNDPITIAIIEDLKEVAKELQEIINEEENLSCTQVYHNAEESVAFLSKRPADLVLTDIGLPGISGIAAIAKLKQIHPQMEFCMFTVFEDADRIFESLKAGAKGYILKNDDPNTIVNSLYELYKGGSPMNPTIARKVIDAFNPNTIKQKPDLPLTPREFEILSHLSKGLLYKEIALELGITVGTVKQHIHKIYDKLQVNNKTEAINLYLDR